MTLSTLIPGARFRLPLCEKTGTLIEIGLNATVKYDGKTERNIGEKVIEYANGNTIISAMTEVEVL